VAGKNPNRAAKELPYLAHTHAALEENANFTPCISTHASLSARRLKLILDYFMTNTIFTLLYLSPHTYFSIELCVRFNSAESLTALLHTCLSFVQSG
jgi:hypothetical protein